MPKIYKIYAKDMLKMCQRYVKYITKICHRYAKHILVNSEYRPPLSAVPM